jgi:hypothetical protein
MGWGSIAWTERRDVQGGSEPRTTGVTLHCMRRCRAAADKLQAQAGLSKADPADASAARA